MHKRVCALPQPGQTIMRWLHVASSNGCLIHAFEEAPVNVQASLCIATVSPGPTVYAYTQVRKFIIM